MFLLLWVQRVAFWGKLAVFCIFSRPCERDAVVCAKYLYFSLFSQPLPCPG